MGFMDKAKKMAEQAQAKLDEAQKQFNQGQSTGQQPSGPAVEYDKHGRPIPSEPPATATPPHGDPVGAPGAAAPPPPPSAPPTPDPAAPAPPTPPNTEGEEDPNRPSYAPPKMTSGDPLG
jgi:hypothetical protein